MSFRAKYSLGLLFLIFSGASALAQVTIDVSKITFEQFNTSKIAPPRTVATWLSGYYHGRSADTLVDAQAFDVNVDRLLQQCNTNLKATVMQVLEKSIRSGK
jgi:acid stress chaperone HdeB